MDTTANTTGNSSPPRFATVLAARGRDDDRPSDLEFLLRSHCHKIRIVERLYGDAHLLIPKVAGTTSSLAIRVYETEATSDETTLAQFMDSFQMTVVFLVRPTQLALDNIHSFFYQAQRLARSRSKTGKKIIRVCLVPNAQVALMTLLSIIEAIQKKELRWAYFERQQARYFLPVQGSIPESCRHTAAIHIAEALRSWADRFDMPPGEVNVLMSMMGSLEKIVTADGLDMIPVEERTKRLLRAFFGRPQEPLPENHRSDMTHERQGYMEHILPQDPDQQALITISDFPQQLRLPHSTTTLNQESMVGLYPHPVHRFPRNTSPRFQGRMQNQYVERPPCVTGPHNRPNQYFQVAAPPLLRGSHHSVVPSSVTFPEYERDLVIQRLPFVYGQNHPFG